MITNHEFKSDIFLLQAKPAGVKRARKAPRNTGTVQGGFLVQKYECAQCGKSYINMKSLKRHVQVHTGEFPFNCDQCNKGFHTQKQLKHHTDKQHYGIQYKCTVCDKVFASMQSREHHMSRTPQ